jgi:hypothetical protein
MSRNLVIGISLLLATATVWAASAGAPFTVRVTLNGSSSAASTGSTSTSNVCVSASGTSAANKSVQVTCTSNVYVNIVQVSPTRESMPSLTGEFITGFGLARSTTFYERAAGQIDDAVALEDQGWNFEGRLYSGNATPERAEELAKWRLRNNEGTLTAIRVVDDNGQAAAVEMLVSF